MVGTDWGGQEYQKYYWRALFKAQGFGLIPWQWEHHEGGFSSASPWTCYKPWCWEVSGCDGLDWLGNEWAWSVAYQQESCSNIGKGSSSIRTINLDRE